jgi:hypothetical protein
MLTSTQVLVLRLKTYVLFVGSYLKRLLLFDEPEDFRTG